jgi:hypothetical protein
MNFNNIYININNIYILYLSMGLTIIFAYCIDDLNYSKNGFFGAPAFSSIIFFYIKYFF